MRRTWVVSPGALAALAVVAVASQGCGGSVGYRGLRVEIDAPVAARVKVDESAAARAQASGEARAELEAEVEVAAADEAPAPAPVPIEGAAVPEFFGIPLDGATDVVFVLDRSGSMTELAGGPVASLAATATPPGAAADPGEPAPPPVPQKIEVARRELIDALQRLEPGTPINVIFFNADIEAFAPALVALEASSRQELVRFVAQTPAEGQTALAAAMRTALLLNPRRVVLLSDGLGNVGDDAGAILRDAREALRGGVRIDTIGLGSNQDEALLRALASESGGLYQRF